MEKKNPRLTTQSSSQHERRHATNTVACKGFLRKTDYWGAGKGTLNTIVGKSSS